MKVNVAAFFVNPLAGYGGIRNNKGSDNMHLQNIGESVSIGRAIEFLSGIKCRDIQFIVPDGPMGALEMDKANLKYTISYSPGNPTTAMDTINFIHSAAGADIICFLGGDGTARDILRSGTDLPVLGIPAGVKMYSSVFSMNVKHAIDVFDNFCGNEITLKDAGVADINEDEYRSGKLDVKQFGTLKIPDSSGIISSSKAEYPPSSSYDMAEYIIDNMVNDFYYIIGPGTTCKAITTSLGFHTNMLGFDIVKGKKLIVEDAGEEDIYRYAASGSVHIIISIIGGQGFLLGRGNQQLSGRIIKKAGFENISVISTPEKLISLSGLAVDISDKDISVPKFIRVLTGYGQFKIMRVNF
ncbi:ATP-NAD kinase family protein [Ferroplasma acidiphilum]|uniref:ATP-NAD kinase family protein n=1 Tax=Ferroplasma acidiphilum TaxID=74969 RepID=A0A7K4FL08_9ARCH|nr:ATP-NAD kinase family protein [Ferroplasma acidiphilum]NOL59723.1 ATP-NAD kinase family protein [Ferroplasma acidiphilum]